MHRQRDDWEKEEKNKGLTQSFAINRRSRCGLVRGWPLPSLHFSFGAAPQVGQRTPSICFGLSSFFIARRDNAPKPMHRIVNLEHYMPCERDDLPKNGAGTICTLASRIMPLLPPSGRRFGSVRFSSGAWPLINTEMPGTGASAPASLSPACNFVVPRAGKVYDARREFRGLPPANCPSRLSSNRTRIVVPALELPSTSVPRSDIALARIFVLTPNHARICVDGKCTSAHRWH